MAFISVGVICYEAFWRRDLLSPPSWFCISKFMLLILSGILVYANPHLGKHLPIYMPWLGESNFIDAKSFMAAADLIAVHFFSYLVFFYISYKFFKTRQRQLVVESYISTNRRLIVDFLTLLGVIGSFSLLSLAHYNFYSNGAYYHMGGFGWANWLVTIFAMHLSIYFLSTPDYRNRGLFLMFLTLVIYGWMLGRGTNSMSLLIISMLALYNPLKNKMGLKAITVVIVTPFILLFTLKYFDYKSVTAVIKKMNDIFLYDVGRFEVMQTSLYYQRPWMQLPWWTMYKIIPFRGYIPIIKDLNSEFEFLTETWMTGQWNPEVGGVSFQPQAEVFLAYGALGLFAFSSFMGIFWGWFYNLAEKSFKFYNGSQNTLIGVYAIIWLENSEGCYLVLQQFLLAFLFIFLLGGVRFQVVTEQKVT